MDTLPFDRLTRSPRTTRDRRGAVRLLAGLAIGSALATAGSALPPVAAATDAARQQDAQDRARRRPKRDGTTCRRGKLVDRVAVPANGKRVASTRLEQGQKYRVRVSGAPAASTADGREAVAAFRAKRPPSFTVY